MTNMNERDQMQAVNGFDIAEQEQAANREDEGTEVHLRGLDDKPMFYAAQDEGTPVPVVITVAGTHSRRYRQAEAEQRRRRLKPKDLTGDRFHEDAVERTAACTLGWDGIHMRGEPVRCDRHNAAMLYRRCPWVLDQVVEAMGDHERFFGSSSPTQ